MLLQTVRPNIVQSIRAFRVEDLMQAAQGANQHFLYANLTNAQSKQDVLEADKVLQAIGFAPNARACESDITIAAAAPSDICDALPAVIVPFT